jgi:hypothetical protein
MGVDQQRRSGETWPSSARAELICSRCHPILKGQYLDSWTCSIWLVLALIVREALNALCKSILLLLLSNASVVYRIEPQHPRLVS